MATSIGRIDLDLGINASGFKRQLNSVGKTAKAQTSAMSGMFGKLGSVIAATFAVGAIVNFSKACIELGSDLAEVQNVVDVTYGGMSDRVNQFAKDAMTSYGLSEKVAKQYMGTFGAMSKAFGYTTEAAYDQAAALTGLAGDVASFYNLTTDEAYTKLKSVFTGETESLKDLGVVMTQTALDEYALQKGMGKTTAEMSEQEKVALRLAFVQDRLATASGDFARTSDGWANQTRVLSLRFDSLKASLGQGLINVLTPVVRWLNILLERLQVVADAFVVFTSNLFGDGGKANTMDSAANSSGILADNFNEAQGSAAAIKKSLSGFDKLNVIDTKSGSSDSSGGGSASGAGGTTNNSVFAQAGQEAKELANKAKEFFDEFEIQIATIGGSLAALGVTKLLGNLGEAIGLGEGFFKTLKNIKKIAGTAITIALQYTLVNEFMDNYVDGKGFKEYLKGALTAAIGTGVLYTMWGTGGLVIGLGVTAVASFKTVIDNGGITNAESATVALTGVATALGAIGIAFVKYDLGTVIPAFFGSISGNIYAMDALAQTAPKLFPLVDAIRNIATFFSNAAGAVSTFVGGLSAGAIAGIIAVVTALASAVYYVWNNWDEAVATVKEFFDLNIAPILEDIKNIWSDIATEIASVGQAFWDLLPEEWQETLKGIWQWICDTTKAIGEWFKSIDWIKGIGEIFEWLGKIVYEHLVDVIGKAIEHCMNVFATLSNMIKTIVSYITGYIKSLIKVFSGLIDFVVGIFTKDWDKAWGGLKESFIGIWDGIANAIKTPLNLVIDMFEGLMNGVVSAVNGIIAAVNKLSFKVPKWVPEIGGKEFGFDIKKMSRVSIPRLATGGYVAANTPQLAIIGDNKREGEIVAPESKIAEAVARGFAMVLGKLQGQNVAQKERPIYLTLQLGEDTFWEGFVDYHNDIVKRTGDSPLMI